VDDEARHGSPEMADEGLNVLSLCSGIGGIELGLKLAVPSARTVCYVEREAFAAACLVARMEEGFLDQAPIWNNLRTFDGEPWRGLVDCVTSGFPCQPHSLAGKRKGREDERWIWPDIAWILREVRPGFVFLENVPGLLTSGFGEVLRDLAGLGLDAEWGVFSAAGVGAPHIRKRLFILAYGNGTDLRAKQRRAESGRPREAESGDDGEGMADNYGFGCGTRERDVHARESDADRSCEGVVNAQCVDGREGALQPEPIQPPFTWPPGPSDRALWQIVADTCGTSLEPTVRGVAHGPPNRLDRLRALGNAVVPVVAARAFLTLARRAEVIR
jgi:DNA (cytosine-5)-methyltransferase 1